MRSFLSYTILRLMQPLEDWSLYIGEYYNYQLPICMNRYNVIVDVGAAGAAGYHYIHKYKAIHSINDIMSGDVNNSEIWIDKLRKHLGDHEDLLKNILPYLAPGTNMKDLYDMLPNDIFISSIISVIYKYRTYLLFKAVIKSLPEKIYKPRLGIQYNYDIGIITQS